ncbi:hypothetical protein EQ845_07155 [Pseudomonas putida]|uniref:hypothetical protein n=1 Tax=Pseudomonas putida TaxID=303 RepID=UPI001179DA56|nr:hypothetical protein [Pseudomonas putida]TRO38309.1 hypothetical protein EQ845_07155 [Pseudomonas putida]
MGFLVTITPAQTGARNRAAMINCAYELKHYMSAATDVTIDHVQMLCPPALTRSAGWSLEELVDIVCFQGIESEESAVVYRTSQGTYKLGELDLRKKKTWQTWYSKKRLTDHRLKISKGSSDSADPKMYSPLYLKLPVGTG